MSKQRILFVDDEPMVLQGLQRILRPFRDEWDMEFAESAAKALELMVLHPFDVIVSDMRMPGTNGAELLKEVMRRFPTTVRLVLSGHADQELVAQCVGVAHQYISKPCDPEQLKAMVRNAGLLAGKLVDEEVKRVIGSIDNLPSIPEVYDELKRALAGDGADPSQLGAIIEKDIGMTAKILKLVNSAFFGLRRTIATPHEAVVYLGTETIKTLVLANSLFEQTKPFKTRYFSISDLWNHTIQVATAARQFSVDEGLAFSQQEEAFVGGILHDVGVLVLASNFEETYDKVCELVMREHVQSTTAEQEYFGVTHAEVGAYLLGLWGLPAPILKIVSLHHRPYGFSETGFSPVVAVHAAEVLSADKGAHTSCGVANFNLEALKRLGLDGHVGMWTASMEKLAGN